MNIPINIYQTASSGTWSFNTQEFTASSNSHLTQILVSAATSTTTFDFYIQDNHKDSRIIYDTRTDDGDATGTLRDSPNIPLVGIYTVYVINSSNDELFTGLLTVSEA